ncbi:FAD-binding domain-containing protein [Cryphonectria parasitica EP155]|uniref:FAD-binding domain-containing protein n=1 Tax=Cryphonectria parasitica (strain ATCC 38755 / EP155) TaxID=660469 RepID=A0A9P4XVM1_CRYP1|nr:FAD-binding domain-containing protein [Cryphonectria parasitica EP155]KAF3761738.1 FAD-binding domain-containing protein [Cryphonectria parasitica EP155]
MHSQTSFHGCTAAKVSTKKEIAVQSLESLSVPFLDANSNQWTSNATAYNLRVPSIPIVIVLAETDQHVRDAVVSGVAAGMKVNARCGGHSYASLGHGGEDNHLVVDLAAINSVTVDPATHIATVGAGARLGHVATELYKQGGRAISHGSCPGVGISGHILHGGYGWASHNKGLALDWMMGASVVLANGTQVYCSETENPDLFWALRGAGSNFGIVVSYTLNTFPVPSVSTPFKVSLKWHTKEEKINGLQALVNFSRTAPPELNMRLGAFASGGQNFEGIYYGSTDDLSKVMTPLLENTGGELTATQGTWLEGLEYYAEGNSLAISEPYKEHGNFYATSLTLKDLSGESLKDFVNFWHTQAIGFKSGSWFILFDLHGGPASAISAIPNSASAYAHRDKAFLVQLYHYVDNEKCYPHEGISLMQGWIKAATQTLKDGDWGMYINYVDSELDRHTAGKLYWGENLKRLKELKKRYDPTEVFYYPQSISPAT